MTSISAFDRRDRCRLLALCVTASGLLACAPQERALLKVDASRCQDPYRYELRVFQAGPAEPCLLSSAASQYEAGAEIAIEVSSAEEIGVTLLLYSQVSSACPVCYGFLWLDSPARDLVLQPASCTTDLGWMKNPDCP